MPEFEMVVVLTGGSYWDQPFLTYHQIMSGFILPALNDPNPWEIIRYKYHSQINRAKQPSERDIYCRDF